MSMSGPLGGRVQGYVGACHLLLWWDCGIFLREGKGHSQTPNDLLNL